MSTIEERVAASLAPLAPDAETREFTVTVKLTCVGGKFESNDAELLAWMADCLNCNRNNIRAEVL